MYETFLQEKAVEATKHKEEKRKNLSPRNRKACPMSCYWTTRLCIAACLLSRSLLPSLGFVEGEQVVAIYNILRASGGDI
jgi:hypothetical protein